MKLYLVQLLHLQHFLLILPGFATDLVGILLVIPFTRKIILNRFVKKNINKKKKK